MGGCCCSARKPHLHGATAFYYLQPVLEEHESSTSNDGTTDSSTPDTFQPPPAPLPYDVVFGPISTDSECRRKTVSGSSFETLFTCEDLEESDCKAQANSELVSPKKIKLLKANECHVLMTAEEDEEEEEICPICLEEYDMENPKTLTKCEHHFHLVCILEWMERSDFCPICDQETIL